MKLIIACIDFSEVTPAVIETSAELAKATGATLLVAYVAFVPLPAKLADATGTNARENAVEQTMDRARAILRLRCEQLRAEHGLDAKTLVLEGVRAAPVLLAEFERQGPDLVVVGSHGYGPLSRLLLGSTSHDIVLKGKWPVLIMPSAKAAAANSATTTPSAATMDGAGGR